MVKSSLAEMGSPLCHDPLPPDAAGLKGSMAGGRTVDIARKGCAPEGIIGRHRGAGAALAEGGTGAELRACGA